MWEIAWGTAGAAAIGSALHGTYYANSTVFGRTLGRLPTSERVVALTFDDGPNPDATPAILDTLRDRGVPATFFVLGRHAERWPALARRIVTEGHAVGNHGYFHRKLHFRGPRYVRRDIELGTRAIQDASGTRPMMFRAPHGFRNPWVTSTARELGQRTVGWSFGVWDSDRPGADEIVHRTMQKIRPGAIVLLHDGDGYDPAGDRMQTAAALPRIIDQLTALGYRFVALPPA
jgi:peptidoglycan/xylan/chitin deacetylase (PgdA/CDA1 family)